MNSLMKFCKKLIIFVVPLLILYAPVFLSGEHITGKAAAHRQHQDKQSILYGPAAENQFRYYKAESSRMIDPSVLLLGDSRALQVRSFFFDHGVNFYNAGYSVVHTADMQYFLEAQDVQNIDMVIIVLSHFSFNANFQDIEYPKHADYKQMPSNGIFDAGIQAKYMWNSIKAGKFILANMSNKNAIGQNAKINFNGMLNDGSYYYGELFAKEDQRTEGTDDRLKDTLNRIKNASSRFEHGDSANPKAFHYLEQFLQYCKNNGIFVIAYAPPYAPAVNNAMLEKGEAYAYQYEMLETVPSIFKEYEFEFYDYTDAASLDCTDDFYLDGFHGSDVVFLRIFMDMMARGSLLNEYCSLEHLRAYDQNRYSDLRLMQTWEQYNRESMK